MATHRVHADIECGKLHASELDPNTRIPIADAGGVRHITLAELAELAQQKGEPFVPATGDGWGDIIGWTVQLKNASPEMVRRRMEELRKNPPKPGSIMVSTDYETWTPVYRTAPGLTAPSEPITVRQVGPSAEEKIAQARLAVLERERTLAIQTLRLALGLIIGIGAGYGGLLLSPRATQLWNTWLPDADAARWVLGSGMTVGVLAMLLTFSIHRRFSRPGTNSPERDIMRKQTTWVRGPGPHLIAHAWGTRDVHVAAYTPEGMLLIPSLDVLDFNRIGVGLPIGEEIEAIITIQG